MSGQKEGCASSWSGSLGDANVPGPAGHVRAPSARGGEGSCGLWEKRDILVIGFISSIASVARLVFHPEGYVKRRNVRER